MDGLEWKTLLKWMIWGYHYFWKHPYKPPVPFNFSELKVQYPKCCSLKPRINNASCDLGNRFILPFSIPIILELESLGFPAIWYMNGSWAIWYRKKFLLFTVTRWRFFLGSNFYIHSPKLTIAHLAGGLAPKGNSSEPTPVFQVLLLLVSGRLFLSILAKRRYTPYPAPKFTWLPSKHQLVIYDVNDKKREMFVGNRSMRRGQRLFRGKEKQMKKHR